MKQHLTRATKQLSTMRKFEVLSANLAIWTASAFVLMTAVTSLAVDRDTAGSGTAGGNWSLRGSLAPADPTLTPAARNARMPTKRLASRL